jgi:twitching motility protein PilT
VTVTHNTPGADLRSMLGRLPEARRPRLLVEAEAPSPEVANLAPGLDHAQPLHFVDGPEGERQLEVLFAHMPAQTDVEELANATQHYIKVALVDPDYPQVFEAVRQMAAKQLEDPEGWILRVLEVSSRAEASDVRIGVGDLPIVKIGGVGWRRLTEFSNVTPEQMNTAATWAAGKRRLDSDDLRDMDVDAACTFRGSMGFFRLRANIYREKGNYGISFRFIPEDPPPFEKLGLPEILASFADYERGLVLVTGATGSGKSTSLAAIIDLINGKHPAVIQTIENPIEFVHTSRKASIHQREVGSDTESFQVAMRSAMRQNPDIVLVGEIRDHEEISTAVTLAETGHLVFATLHTNSAAQTLSRLVDVFPAEQQNQIRTQLSLTLKAVVCQHLFKRLDDPNRGVVCSEVMIINDAIATLIRRGDFDKIGGYILDGAREGMQHMDHDLADAVSKGLISEAQALPWVTRQQQYDERRRESQF